MVGRQCSLRGDIIVMLREDIKGEKKNCNVWSYLQPIKQNSRQNKKHFSSRFILGLELKLAYQ